MNFPIEQASVRGNGPETRHPTSDNLPKVHRLRFRSAYGENS